MLNVDELFELSIFFELVSTPILRKEILADLEKKSTAERNSLDVMKSLCAKMARSGLEPMEYRQAALSELQSGRPIAMHGAMLIDLSAAHVSVGHSGGIHFDGRQLQWDWRRWAAGDFTDKERSLAANHRKDIDDYDPESLRQRSKAFATKFFGDCKNIESLVARIDMLMDDPNPITQEMILGCTANWLGATKDFQRHLLSLLRMGRIGLVKDYAPFATSITRLTFAYQFGLAKGFFGPRRSDVCDLEYLYYAPFCRFFVSGDRLHKSLWAAATTNAQFCTGAELKADLKRRAELRKEAPEKVAGPTPIPLENSLITTMFRVYSGQV
jgi:hypothetical protein